MDSPFDVLLIDSDADEGEIERAYRRRVKQTHPDHGGSSEEFQRVRAAYNAITAKEPWNGGGGDIDNTHREAPDPDAEDEGQETEPDPEARVEYLNYEVLDDYGWTLDDEDLFEKAAAANLDQVDYGRLVMNPNDPLLGAAETCGLAWPFSCRGGACANCAIAVTAGDLSQPTNHILPPEMTDRGIRLSCVGTPTTDELQIVFNVKHLPDLDDLRLPPGPFEHARPSD